MFRKKKRLSLPLFLKGNLHININTGTYDIEEDGITYMLNHGQLAQLKMYIHEMKKTSVIDWYKSLSKTEQKQVQRKTPENGTEYYGDGEFLE